MRTRTTVTLALALAVGLGLLSACVDDRPRISIEFGAAPELFTGKQVLIDGRVVGRLETTGQVTRISFPVSDGSHEVCVIVPGYACQTRTVEVRGAGMKAHLLLNVLDGTTENGEPLVGFQ